MCKTFQRPLLLGMFLCGIAAAAYAQSGPYALPTRQQGPNYILYGAAQVPAQSTIQDKFGTVFVSPLYQYDTSVSSLEEAQYRMGTNTQPGYTDPNLPAGLGAHGIKIWFDNTDAATQTPDYPNGGVGATHVSYPLVGSAATKELMNVGIPAGNLWQGNWTIDGATGGSVNGGKNPGNLLQLAQSAPIYELFHSPDLTVFDLEAAEFGSDNEGDACGSPFYTVPAKSPPNGSAPTKWTAANWACVYNEFYELTTYLLKTYNNSGKTFILQEWEGDSELNEQNAWGAIPLSVTCTAGNMGTTTIVNNYCQSVLNMRQWYTLRWAGANDARRDMMNGTDGSGYRNVTVAVAAEAGDIDNYFPSTGSQIAPTLMDVVLPYLHMDLYSCSCYYEDTLGIGESSEKNNNSLGNLTNVPVPDAGTVPRDQQMYNELSELRATIHQPQTNLYLPNGQLNPNPVADSGPALFGDSNGVANNSIYLGESGAKEVEYYTYDDWGEHYSDPFLSNTPTIPSDQISRMSFGQEFQGLLSANARYMFLWALYTNGTLSDAKPTYDSIDSLWLVRPPCNATSDAIPGNPQAWCIPPASSHGGVSSFPAMWTYLSSIMSQTISTYQNTYEAENFYTGVSGPAVSGQTLTYMDLADSSASGSYATSLQYATVGSTISYAMFVPLAGKQAVQMRVKNGPAQGQFQVYLNGSSAPLPCGPYDTYASAGGYSTITVGSANFTPGEYALAIKVSGKNSASTGYNLVIDNIQIGNVLPVPCVTGTTPVSGPAAGGTVVTISGANFTGATAVSFGASAAASFTLNSDTSITATSPAGSGTVDVTVTAAGGTSAITIADVFTYLPAPAVTGVSPGGGPVTGGTTVTITGTNFTGATAVRFGGTAVTSFTVNSATSITATSPSGTGTVHVTVITSNGTSAASAADQYVYIALVQSFTVNVPSPLTIVTKDQATVTVTLTPVNGFSGITTLACGQMPIYATCSFPKGNSVNVNGSAATLQLTIHTLTPFYADMDYPQPHSGLKDIVLSSLLCPAACCLFFVRKKWNKRIATLLLMLLVLGSAAGISGCGSGVHNTLFTPPGTYGITIQGTSGSMVNAATLTLIVTS